MEWKYKFRKIILNYLFYLGAEAPLPHNRTPTIPSSVWCSYLLWRGLRPDPEFKLFLISTITFTILQLCSEKRLSTDKIIPFLSLKDLKLIGKSYISKSRKNNKSLLMAFKLTVVFLKRIVKLRKREGQRVDLGRSLKGHL